MLFCNSLLYKEDEKKPTCNVLKIDWFLSLSKLISKLLCSILTKWYSNWQEKRSG